MVRVHSHSADDALEAAPRFQRADNVGIGSPSIPALRGKIRTSVDLAVSPGKSWAIVASCFPT